MSVPHGVAPHRICVAQDTAYNLHIMHICGTFVRMKLIAQLKLHPTSEHAHALRETLHTANAVCNQISTIAWESKTFKQFPLHRLVYSVFNDILPSNILVRCIAKVADAYKLDKNTKRVFRPTGALAYNDRTLSWNLKGSEVSILTRNGRIKVPFACGERQRQLLETRHGESDLVSINRQWYLFATCDVDDPTPADVDDALGVDVGIVNLATDSDGETYSGEQVEQKRQWYTNRRQTLQKVGTLASKRRL